METTIDKLDIKSDQRFLPYLWGMETTLKINCFTLYNTFLPYLWGMETLPPFGSPSGRMGSYRTYEEWKLFSASFSKNPSCRFLPYLWGMETSELGNRIRGSITVLTVPMRNGNFRQSCHLPVQVLFLPYLWGMETVYRTSHLGRYPRSYRTYEEWKLKKDMRVF